MLRAEFRVLFFFIFQRLQRAFFFIAVYRPRAVLQSDTSAASESKQLTRVQPICHLIIIFSLFAAFPAFCV